MGFFFLFFFWFVYLYSGACRTGIILMYMISLLEKLVQEFDFFFLSLWLFFEGRYSRKGRLSVSFVILKWGRRGEKIKMKYVLVTGGVVSGLGKGVTASSIGLILKACGLRVTAIKIGICCFPSSPFLFFHITTGKCLFFFSFGWFLMCFVHEMETRNQWVGFNTQDFCFSSDCNC